MQLGNVTTDAAKDYGITFVRQLYNASQPATIPNDQGEQVPNPALFANDYDYALSRLGGMISAAIDSWAKQADEAAANPPPSEPGSVTADWRPQAVADLNVLRAKLLGILTSMQMDYTANGQADSAAACLNAKTGVKVIETAPAVQTAYLAQPGSRAAYDAAVKARWGEIVAPAPAQVKADFNKYGGNTV